MTTKGGTQLQLGKDWPPAGSAAASEETDRVQGCVLLQVPGRVQDSLPPYRFCHLILYSAKVLDTKKATEKEARMRTSHQLKLSL